ncbi:glycosyltransferase family 4 protein [Tellurirhabdus bombi]|uniref:glycosyltransferase family 4 protein n=1 Tax=Tellurirhabdus bombi TaxID=2907205 RepID=UPI001F3615E6|nr:glycosyltransferase family 4 protein [Tellurirhabdus bombi]
MKILAIHNILWAHYKARIFNGIFANLSDRNIDFYVLQMAYSERSRWGLKTDLSIHNYPYQVLFPDKAIEQIGKREKIRRLLQAVRNYKPDIVYLNGYYDLAYWAVIAYCKIKNIRIVLDFESSEISRKRSWWKEAMKRGFLQQCDALVCLGQKAADYAIKLNVSPEKILSTKNVGVDNEALLALFNKEFPLREQRKKALGLPLYNFLYAGRFVERKNLYRLIKAFHNAQKIAKNGKDWGVILSGEGDQKEPLMQAISALGNTSVFFLEPCEWYEVPIRYTMADVAVLPSTFEPFGFLTNEAMVYSMPVLVSDRCGSAADLVIDKYNGFQFNPYDEEDLTQKMVLLMNAPEQFRTLGDRGKQIIDQWGPDIIVDELIQAFLKVARNG